jgi:uncharacterized protein
MPGATTKDQAERIAEVLTLDAKRVFSALELFDGGASVPFVARYRKDRTGSLDEVALRKIANEASRLRALDARREAITSALEERGVLDETLRRELESATSLATLEDLYAPWKQARKTRGAAALERGLGPLAEKLLDARERGVPLELAAAFVSPEKGVASPDAALEGALDVIRDRVATDPLARARVRELFWEKGRLSVSAARGKLEQVLASKFRDLVSTAATRAEKMPRPALDREARRLPAHRILAVNRGEREGLLSVSVKGSDEEALRWLSGRYATRPDRPAGRAVALAVESAYHDRLAQAASNHVRARLSELAEDAALETFERNLRAILLAPPVPGQVVLGFDPGFANGCKLAVVDATGKVLGATTIFPHTGKEKENQARATLTALVGKHGVTLVAIGNGTGARESAKFVRAVLGKKLEVAIVAETGASVYSASDLAREELPDLDVTLRGAVSIARRVQDPLAELVKVEPKSLGVGQYQHDVDEKRLEQVLDGVVEDAVSAVGCDANTASAALLRRVAGIGPGLAAEIVSDRNARGPFSSRADLRRVKGLGPRTFEQAAGFLRVTGPEPLDRTAVHPESYDLALRIARELELDLRAEGFARGALAEKLAGVDPERFVSPLAGVETVRDILSELARPGRDPRGTARSFEYAEGIEKIEDLRVGMKLPGTVTNVTDFGAFVDLGVHRDGLVHVSQLADHRVGHPSDVVAPGDQVEVRVLEVDLERGRISLSMRSPEAPGRK